VFLSSNNPVFSVEPVFLVCDDFVNVAVNFFHAVTVGSPIEDFAFHAIGNQNQATRHFFFDNLVFVFHVQRLGENSRTVKHFLNVFFTCSVDFHLATPVVPCCVRRTFRFEDVAEALPELATDVDEVRGVEDLRVHSSVRVEIVVGVVVRIHFVFHVVKLSDFFDFVNRFFRYFFLEVKP